MLWELKGVVINFGELCEGFLEELTFGPSLEDEQKSLPNGEDVGVGQ